MVNKETMREAEAAETEQWKFWDEGMNVSGSPVFYF